MLNYNELMHFPPSPSARPYGTIKAPLAIPGRMSQPPITRNARTCPRSLPNTLFIEAEPVPDEMALSFRVRFALSVEKTSIHIGNKSQASTLHPYDFYCGAWMGGDSPHLEFKLLTPHPDGSAEARISLPLQKTDVDVLKLGLYVHDPDTGMNRHICSGFQSLDWIKEGLAAKDFDSATRSMVIKDNYTPNQALLHFCNDSTDLDSLCAILPHLRRSVLHDNSKINAKVMALTFGVHEFIEKAANVSPLNGGVNFVNSTCFTQCMGCAINYPLLDLTYSSERHRAPLSMLAYMAIATVHGSGQSPEALLALDEPEYMSRYVVPLCTSFTVCPCTSVYSGDQTMAPSGKLDMATEDFAMVMSKHHYLSLKKDFLDVHGPEKLRAMSPDDLSNHIRNLLLRKGPQDTDGHFLISDDCETLSGLIKAIEGSIRKYHLECSSKPGSPDDHDKALAQMMWDDTRDMPNLAAVPFQDFHAVARLLGRYARLRKNCEDGKSPAAQMGLSIVSAKGPSFSTVNRQLSGHACVVAQTLSSSGAATYTVAEGTSHLMMRNLPPGCPSHVVLPLTEGVKRFETSEALSILASNLSSFLKTCGKSRIREYIPHTFEGQDPYDSCPFYMAGFFVGLEMGSCTPGVIPLEQRVVKSLLLKDEENQDNSGKKAPRPTIRTQPMFGAPVVNLSGDNVMAMPVNLGKIFGEEEGHSILKELRLRNGETYIGRETDQRLKCLMGYWGDQQPLDTPASCCDLTHTWVVSCSESFKNAEVLRAVFEHKTRLARKFNANQAEDPKSDGVRMVAKMHMLSVVSHFYVPLPTKELWAISSARSMQKAVASMPKFWEGLSSEGAHFARMVVSD